MVRRRRGLPEREPGAGFTDIAADPTYIGGVAEAPFVRLPDPGSLFTSRARRLRGLAEGHTMGDYLRFLAQVVDTQAAAVAALPAPKPIPPDQLAPRNEHAMPPISEDQVRGDAHLAATLGWLPGHVDLAGAPEAARAAAAAVRAMTQAEGFALAADIFHGAFPADRIAESLFVAAALQVHLARLASQLEAASVTPPAEGVCPVCGGAPVASVVVGWTQASKARYCACSLCGTLWNHVRIRCTACGSTEDVQYYTIEDGPKSVGIEACGACRSYIKHMQQHEEAGIDPVADDVASYALDLLARGEDFHRSGLNPLFLTG